MKSAFGLLLPEPRLNAINAIQLVTAHSLPGLALPVPQVFGATFLKQQQTAASRSRDSQSRPRLIARDWQQQTAAGGWRNGQRSGTSGRKRNMGRKAEKDLLLRSMFGALLPPMARGQRSFGGLQLPHALYEFQAEGVKFLLRTTPGALLADDMGLGKTVQSIVAMRLLARMGELNRALVVASKSVITSWRQHFVEWAPDLVAEPIQGDRRTRQQLWGELHRGEIDVGIITYQSLLNDAKGSAVRTLIPEMDLVIADEVQKIKNPATKTHQMMKSLPTHRRWGLTGTPLENNVQEPAAILNYLDQRVPLIIYSSSALRQHLDSHMLRRKKEDVLDDLPDLFSHIESIALTPEQRQAYYRAEKEGVSELANKPRSITNVLTLITRLKQICNAAHGQSAKLDWLCEYAESARAEGDQVLVFSQYVETLNLIEQGLSKFDPLKYYGGMSGHQRDVAVRAFRAGNQHQVMILQVHAGGLGLNLQTANRVIHFDSWWNPAVQSQATARAHRLGQSKTVFETTLVSVNTIEERIQTLLATKRELFARTVDDLSVAGLAKQVNNVDELYGLFGLRKGAA